MGAKGVVKPKAVLLRLDPVLLARLDRVVELRGVERSVVLREAVEALVEGQERDLGAAVRSQRPAKARRVEIARNVVSSAEAKVGVQPRNWRA